MKDDGGSAFPIPNSDLIRSYAPTPGMSLRDWYAGMAINSIILGNTEFCKLGGKAPSMGSIAGDCYAVADALIAEMNKSK